MNIVKFEQVKVLEKGIYMSIIIRLRKKIYSYIHYFIIRLVYYSDYTFLQNYNSLNICFIA